MSKKAPRSQAMDLFLHVAELLGCSTDKQLADLADVSVDNVANWRDGTVREWKPQTLRAIKDNLSARLHSLREQHERTALAHREGLVPVEIEEGSEPAALQRKFVDRVTYDYAGHRFLYFDPQGALAWENLIKAGYDQHSWLAGVEQCVPEWLDPRSDSGGRVKGPLARALGLGKRDTGHALDIVSLGPGDGGKEMVLLERLLRLEREHGYSLASLGLALVDVSIPLLLKAAKAAHQALRAAPEQATRYYVLPFCADVEEGELGFVRRLRTHISADSPGVRLVAILGNVFGNLRDEDSFVRQRLCVMTRPGDFVWLEVGRRLGKPEDDPLFPMTRADHPASAAEQNRRLLLEGPYRRWEAALGRSSRSIELRISVRENDDSARVPGSYNFCHDLVLADERRACTMLYSRRYDLEALAAWFEARRFAVEATQPVVDSDGRQRVAHLLLRRL